MNKSIPVVIWWVLLVLALPIFRYAQSVKPADPPPDHWRLHERIDGWRGQLLYYSEDESVTQAFLEQDILTPGVCPLSGKSLDTVSPVERRILPSDVEIQRRLYRDPGGQRERLVILLVTGESREGIHRPESCIVSQGVKVGARRQLVAQDASGDAFRFGVYPLIRQGMPDERMPRRFFIYWYEGSDAKTPYNVERILRMGWNRLISGRVQRWAYFSIQLEVPSHVADPDAYLSGAVEWLVKADQSGTEASLREAVY